MLVVLLVVATTTDVSYLLCSLSLVFSFQFSAAHTPMMAESVDSTAYSSSHASSDHLFDYSEGTMMTNRRLKRVEQGIGRSGYSYEVGKMKKKE